MPTDAPTREPELVAAESALVRQAMETLAPPPLLSGSELVARVQRVREVMRDLMKENVHFGVVPGTHKPSLWKPGAELLLMTFRIGPRLEVTDLSTADEIRYRIKVVGFAQTTGEPLAEGIGEASTNEEKYRWRGAVHDKEWTTTLADRRRIKYTRKGEEIRQVRTSPADLANTVLLMAVKRATLNMTRIVTACSDIFDQDIEDLPEDWRQDPGTPAEELDTSAPLPQRRDRVGHEHPYENLPEHEDARDHIATGSPPVLITKDRAARLPDGVVLITRFVEQSTKNPRVKRFVLQVTGNARWPANQTTMATIDHELAAKAESAFNREQPVRVTTKQTKFGFDVTGIEDAGREIRPSGEAPPPLTDKDIPF